MHLGGHHFLQRLFVLILLVLVPSLLFFSNNVWLGDDENKLPLLPSLTVVQEEFEEWKWTLPPRNLLFIKIPKTGGTTLAEILQRTSQHTRRPSFVLARLPHNASHVDTCSSLAAGEANWRAVIQYNRPQRINVFASHACFRKYMTYAKYWSSPPLAITLMRNPLDQFTSKYRFVRVCCDHHASVTTLWTSVAWCANFCKLKNLDLTTYVDFACKDGLCNEQKRYMGSRSPESIINNYFLVLILERFVESLCVLHVKVGIPVQALVHLPENANTLTSKPQYSREESHLLLKNYLGFDSALYKLANSRLTAMVANFTPEHEAIAFSTCLRTVEHANQKAREECVPECENQAVLSPLRKRCFEHCLGKSVKRFFASNAKL